MDRVLKYLPRSTAYIDDILITSDDGRMCSEGIGKDYGVSGMFLYSIGEIVTFENSKVQKIDACWRVFRCVTDG